MLGFLLNHFYGKNKDWKSVVNIYYDKWSAFFERHTNVEDKKEVREFIIQKFPQGDFAVKFI